jgi:hypothetical protein
MRLSHVFRKGARPHPVRQRPGIITAFRFLLVKKIHDKKDPVCVALVEINSTFRDFRKMALPRLKNLFR